jgi:hypothetical protein
MSGQEQRLTFRLLSYWNRIRGDREFPSLRDVNIGEISEMWHYTFTIELQPDGHHSFQYFGPELINILNEDYSGQLVETAMEDGMLANLIGFFDKVLEQRSPVSESSQFYNEGKEVRYRSLIVPLSGDGGEIKFLIGTTNYKIYD